MPQQASIVDKQLIEVPIQSSGQTDPNRMFICTGKMQTYFSAGNNQTVRETFKALIEPKTELTEGQFRRAIATASVTDISMRDWDAAQTDSFEWAVEEAQADLDDESNQVELRVSLMARVTGNAASLYIQGVAFQVTILARI